MKSYFKFCLTFLIAQLIYSCSDKTPTATYVEKVYKVWGNCEQCKATIESAAKVEGVAGIDWNEDSKLLKFKIDTSKVSVNAVLQSVANSGYDNELFTADDKAYSGLPECCQYERKPHVN